MIRQDDVKEGVALKFITPDSSPSIVGLVQRVEDGFAWMSGLRWPVDVVALNSTIIHQPTPEHRWDGALERWYSPSEKQPMGNDIVLGHARHA